MLDEKSAVVPRPQWHLGLSPKPLAAAPGPAVIAFELEISKQLPPSEHVQGLLRLLAKQLACELVKGIAQLSEGELSAARDRTYHHLALLFRHGDGVVMMTKEGVEWVSIAR